MSQPEELNGIVETADIDSRPMVLYWFYHDITTEILVQIAESWGNVL